MQRHIRALYFIRFMTQRVPWGWVWRWFYQPVFPVGVFKQFPWPQ